MLRVLAFLAALAAVFGVALATGAATDPVDTEPTAHAGGAHPDTDEVHRGHADRPASAAADELPGGLMTALDGYRLVLEASQVRAGEARPLAFTIVGSDGRPVTGYDVAHEKLLHLIAVRRDFSGYQHVHPVLADGRWTTELDLTPGSWRVFADFSPSDGGPLTLGADLAVAGTAPLDPPLAETRSTSVDGYTVTVTGDLASGSHADLTLSVARDGRPVSDLQPYLGAYGHLVALREGDLAYLHVHPSGGPGDGVTPAGPNVDFGVEVPSEGTYHLYLDFRHGGVVRTAHLVLPAGPDDHRGVAHEH